MQFKTLQELEENFPVGKVYYEETVEHICWYYNDNDIYKYKEMYIKVEYINDETVKCTELIQRKVEGYIFDGEYWYPAVDSWDGWYPIEECEINIGEV